MCWSTGLLNQNCEKSPRFLSAEVQVLQIRYFYQPRRQKHLLLLNNFLKMMVGGILRRTHRLDVYNALFNGFHDKAGCVFHAQFFNEVSTVPLSSSGADEEFFAYFFGRIFLANQLQYFYLSA